MKLFKILSATFLLGSLTLVPIACGNADDDCVAGKQCECTGNTCNFDCGAGDSSCQFDCGAGQECDASCDGGGCQMTCNGSKSCVLACPGGGCQLTCNGDTAECRIVECQTSCQLACNGAEVCDSSCSPLDGGCNTTE
jgi:hypothetical protein